MSTPDYETKYGDLPDPLEALLIDRRNVAVDLSTATLLEFHAKSVNGGEPVISAAATAIDPPQVDRNICYTFVPGDDLVPVGDYLIEFYVEWGSTRKRHFPTDPSLLWRVVPNQNPSP